MVWLVPLLARIPDVGVGAVVWLGVTGQMIRVPEVLSMMRLRRQMTSGRKRVLDTIRLGAERKSVVPGIGELRAVGLGEAKVRAR
jgi:hypothetical protein